MVNKSFKIGSIGFTVSFSNRIAEIIRENILYRLIIKPARQLIYNLRHRTGGSNGKSSRRNGAEMERSIVSAESPEQKSILKKISEVDWYHSIDLGYGIVTHGKFDHRPLIEFYRLPENLTGMRTLDVATYDGFWAFEFEKRNAEEVVAMDIRTWNEIDIPPRIRVEAPKEMLDMESGLGFNIAHDILRSKVKRGIMNVYDLSPEWMGKFDFVFCSDLLLHLMNPVKALQNIYSVVSGCAYIIDVYDPEFGEEDSDLTLRYLGGTGNMAWWRFGLGSLKKMIKDAGFDKVELLSKFEFSLVGQKERHWHVVFRACP